ncbi:MAG: hypothetical protein E7H36_11430 [Bifidobacterium dentium]|nr:hypothetical protein [Bifidobacterium dentium]
MLDIFLVGFVLIFIAIPLLYLVVKAAIMDALKKSGLMDVLKVMHDEQVDQTNSICSRLH